MVTRLHFNVTFYVFHFLLVYEYYSFCFYFLSNLANILQITNGQLHFRSFITNFQNTGKLNFVLSAQIYSLFYAYLLILNSELLIRKVTSLSILHTSFTCFILHSYPSD